jgi:hypothetical protein
MARAVGNQGNWFARVEAPYHPEVHGKNLPCVWDYWWFAPNGYRDKGYKAEDARFIALVDGLRRERFAILRKRKASEPHVWEANGYVAIYEISDVETESDLAFKFVRRVCDLD